MRNFEVVDGDVTNAVGEPPGDRARKPSIGHAAETVRTVVEPKVRMQSSPITVTDLICLLQEAPGEAIVYSEGCDCCEESFGIEIHDNHVVVARRRA